MAFRRGERGKCNEPVDDAGEHLVPHTHIGYAARDGRSWGSRLGDKAGHGGLTAASFVRGLMTMSRKTGMRGKAIAVICCLALLVGCTGCGALKEGLRRERQSQQGQSSQQGERIASSAEGLCAIVVGFRRRQNIRSAETVQKEFPHFDSFLA